MRPMTVIDCITTPSYTGRKYTGEERFYKFLETVQSLLPPEERPLRYFQMKAIMLACPVVIRLILGSEFVKYAPRIFKRMGIKEEATPIAMILAPRRYGKSVFYEYVIPALGLWVSEPMNWTLAMIAQGLRVCLVQRENIYGAMINAGFGSRVQKVSPDGLLIMPFEGKPCTIKFYPNLADVRNVLYVYVVVCFRGVPCRVVYR